MQGIICYLIPVETYWSIKKIEKYYTFIWRIYNIDYAEIKGILS